MRNFTSYVVTGVSIDETTGGGFSGGETHATVTLLKIGDIPV